MTIIIDNRDGKACLIPAAVDIYCAGELRSALLAACESPAAEIEIDLSAVTAMDSAGVQVLMAAKRLAGEHGKDLRLTRHGPVSLEVIDRYNLAGFFGDPLVIGEGQE
jgi:anti-anti-sigma factor